MQFHQNPLTGIRASQKEKDLSRLLYRKSGSGYHRQYSVFELFSLSFLAKLYLIGKVSLFYRPGKRSNNQHYHYCWPDYRLYRDVIVDWRHERGQRQFRRDRERHCRRGETTAGNGIWKPEQIPSGLCHQSTSRSVHCQVIPLHVTSLNFYIFGRRSYNQTSFKNNEYEAYLKSDRKTK